MEIKFDEQNKKIIESVRTGEDNIELFLLSPDSEKCSLELKIHDPYKCHEFLREIFYNKKEYLKDELGFEVAAISRRGVYSDGEKFKEEITNTINDLINKYL